MSWVETGTKSAARSRSAMVSVNGYAYILGGRTDAGAAVAIVDKAEFEENGEVPNFSADTAIPAARSDGVAVVVRRSADGKDYLVFLGGYDNGGTAQTAVYYTTQGTSGTLAAWTTAGGSAPLPATRADSVAVVYGEHIILVGGMVGGSVSDSVIYNTIDGIIAGSAWTSTTALPDVVRRASGAIDSRVIFLAGGTDDVADALDTVYAGVISETAGVITIAWQETAEFPKVVVDQCSVAYDHHFYVFGGHDGSNLGTDGTDYYDVYRSPILSNGTLGDWQKVSTVPVASFTFGSPAADASVVMCGDTGDGMLVATGRYPSLGDQCYANCWFEDTPTFWKLAAKSDQPVGYVRKIHVYIDGVTEYRWCDSWFSDGSGFDHDPIIKDIGVIQRGLGMDHYPQAADVGIVLNNDDLEADWLVDQETAGDVLNATVRIFIGAYSLASGRYVEELIAWQQLGEYYISDNPVRTINEVSFGLTENTRGILVDISQTPTVRDWVNSGTSPITTAPLSARREIPDEVLDTPIPLAFGKEEAFGLRCYYGTPQETITDFSAGQGGFLYVICATKNPTTPTLQRAFAEFTDNQEGWPVGVVEIGNNIESYVELKISSSFSKYGATWYVVYALVSLQSWSAFTALDLREVGNVYDYLAKRFGRFTVTASPLSGMTAAVSDGKTSPEQVVRDLVGHYTTAGLAYLDEKTITRAEQALHRNSYAAGTVGSQEEVRTAIGSIMASWDMDAYSDYTGRLAIAGGFRDYDSQVTETSSLFELDETDIWDVSDRHPSRGQRWAVANRIFYDDVKESLRAPDAVSPGPWSNASTLLGSSRFVEQRVSVAWRTVADAGLDPWTARGIDYTPRPIIKFKTTLAMLRVDLGAYFKLSWTRNQSSPYTSAVFKVEQMSIDTANDEVTVDAVWVADLTTSRPFLLDLKSNLTRVESTGTVTVTDSSDTMTFSTANVLTSNGVVVGDQIILKDSTESATGFKRNRTLNITSVDSGTQLKVTDADLDFGTGGGGLAVSAWEIRRSYLTQPSTAFPNYPSPGAAVFGKISSTDSPPEYSDASTANALLEG